MFYDAKRDASLARATRSTAAAAAERARGADGAGFDDNAVGGAGGDDNDATLEEALRVFMARLQAQRLVGALAPDVAALHDHVRLTIDESSRQLLPRVDVTHLDVDALRDAVTAATTHCGDGGDVPDVSAAMRTTSAAEHDAVARLPVRSLTVALIDNAINTLTAPMVPGEGDDVRVSRLRVIERPTIGDVSAAFTLNAEQHEAFRLAATPVLDAIRDNLQCSLAVVAVRAVPQHIVIAGAGGSGKSRVIDALRHLAAQWRVQRAVIVAAFTGAAAVLLRGRTLHSVLGMNRDSADESKKSKKRKRASRDEQNVANATKRALDAATVIVVDEMSMISLSFLVDIDYRLRTVRAVDKPFGGLTAVFAGDLLQLPPVGGRPLWDVTDQSAVSVRGRELWRLFVSVVFLCINMRCDDARYAAMLERTRYGIWTDDDIALINTRLLGAGVPPLQLATTDHVTTLVHTNASRVEINRNALLSAAAQLPAGEIVCVRGDIRATRGGRVPTAADIELLHDIDDSKESNNLSATLYLYIGQRVSVTENVATVLGAANGSQGTVVGFKFAGNDDGASSTEQRDVLIAGVTVRVAFYNKHIRTPRNILLVEQILVDEEAGIVGAIDATYIDAETGSTTIIDFKRSGAAVVDEQERAARRFGTGPASRVPASRLGSWCLQLHVYLFLVLANTRHLPFVGTSTRIDLAVLQLHQSLSSFVFVPVDVDVSLMAAVVRNRVESSFATPCDATAKVAMASAARAVDAAKRQLLPQSARDLAAATRDSHVDVLRELRQLQLVPLERLSNGNIHRRLRRRKALLASRCNKCPRYEQRAAGDKRPQAPRCEACRHKRAVLRHHKCAGCHERLDVNDAGARVVHNIVDAWHTLRDADGRLGDRDVFANDNLRSNVVCALLHNSKRPMWLVQGGLPGDRA